MSDPNATQTVYDGTGEMRFPVPTWPTKICGPNLVEVLNAAGFYQKKEWVGLTYQEIFEIENGVPDNVISDRDWTVYFAKAIEAKLFLKNKEPGAL